MCWARHKGCRLLRETLHDAQAYEGRLKSRYYYLSRADYLGALRLSPSCAAINLSRTAVASIVASTAF